MYNLLNKFIFFVSVAGLLSITFTADIPVLMYHHIRTPSPTDNALLRDLSFSPANFSKHLDYLAESGYTPITLKDLPHTIPGNNIKSKTVILTFDDGYADNWQAFLELRKRKLKGVFFIITSQINKPGHLNASQIREMSQSGMEIGSHTVHHYNLSTLKVSLLESEVVQSKVVLENITSKSVISLCYPSGKYSPAVMAALKTSGYRYGRTTLPGVNLAISANYEIKVIRIHNYSLKLPL